MIPSGEFFTKQYAWLNGFYEIEIELGESSDERLAQATARIWAHPSLDGCYLHRDREPKEQELVNPAEHASGRHLYGIAHLPNGSACICGTFHSRIENDQGIGSRDFLGFYLPLASLEAALRSEKLPFTELDAWLVELGKFVFERIKFDLALVGFEVGFPKISAEQLKLNGVPAARHEGYLVRTGNRLEWFPPSSGTSSKYSLELAESTATLQCSCCDTGLTSVCGFIRKDSRPYGMYYALIHNAAKVPFVRISVSIGDWWRHDTYENRHALCIDVIPSGEKHLRMSIQSPSNSPQQDLATFGRWIDLEEAAQSPLRQDFLSVLSFVLGNDPAVRAGLDGKGQN